MLLDSLRYAEGNPYHLKDPDTFKKKAERGESEKCAENFLG